MKYIVNDYLDTYGGSTTLLLRMGEWAKETKNKLIIYTPKIGNREITKKLQILGVEIVIFDTDKLFLLTKKIEKNIDTQCIFINFTFKHYMDIEVIKKKTHASFVNVLYAIHPDTYLKGLGYSNKLIKQCIKKIYKPLILKLNESGTLLSMDKDIVSRTETYYNFKLFKNMHIQLLPMIVPEYTGLQQEEEIERSFNSKKIISACRADFPFKGYVFGLLDAFEKLKEEYDDISLEMICSGEKNDTDKIKNKIKSLSDKARGSIHCHSWMDYDKLQKLTDSCYLSVGMGTAVIDAAALCVPSIAVKYNTYDLIGNHIFYEKPELLVAYDGEAIVQIKRLLNLTFEEYRNVAIKCYESVKEQYNIEKFFEYINSIKSTESRLSNFDVILHCFNSYINSKKNLKEYSINEIEKEE